MRVVVVCAVNGLVKRKRTVVTVDHLNVQHVSTKESLDALVQVVPPALAVKVDSAALTAVPLAKLDADAFKVPERCVLWFDSCKHTRRFLI